jgi:hypothetical protein
LENNSIAKCCRSRQQGVGNVSREREAQADADKFVENLKAIWQPK